VAKSLDELNELIFEKINKIDGVIKTETSLFLNYIKRQYDWGTALY
jgi:DNA-binding Lrp family transcriptional regulator